MHLALRTLVLNNYRIQLLNAFFFFIYEDNIQLEIQVKVCPSPHPSPITYKCMGENPLVFVYHDIDLI